MEASSDHSDGNIKHPNMMATSATDASHNPDAFPFMRLPPELRLMVYHLALRDITNPIMYPTSDDVQKPQPYRGALALLHSSKFLRLESFDALWHIVDVLNWNLLSDCLAVAEENVRFVDSGPFDDNAFEQMQKNYERSSSQARSMTAVKDALKEVRNANPLLLPEHLTQRDPKRITAILMLTARPVDDM